MNGCCIVETRPFSNLGEFIIDHLKYVPTDWGLTIYCSHKNYHLVKDVDYKRKTNIIVLSDSEMNTSKYNKLLKSVSFWESLPYKKVLIFQTDSFILREGILVIVTGKL